MKKIILLLFLGFGLVSQGQNISNMFCYINNNPIDLDYIHLHPDNIDSINVNKDTNVNVMYIFTKTGTEYVTLEQIVNERTQLNAHRDQILYVINNRVVKSKSEVRIDKKLQLQVYTNHLTDIDYLDKKHKNINLVNIVYTTNDNKIR